MSQGMLAKESARALDDPLNSLRRRLSAWPAVSHAMRAMRALVHFGPWRSSVHRLISQLRPPGAASSGRESFFLGPLDCDAVATQLRHHSVAIIGTLPHELLARLRETTDRLPVGHYELMHEIDSDVRRIADDLSVKDLLRACFKAEPVLLESTLVVTDPRPNQPDVLQNRFHFDFAGWQSLNVLVYLTDVSSQSSAHVIAKGSHRRIRIGDALRGAISDAEATRRFGSSIETITGPAGTVFVENTEAFHRRIRGSGRRVLLNLLYSSHRGWLASGRTSRSHKARRAKLLAHLRDSSCAAQSGGDRR